MPQRPDEFDRLFEDVYLNAYPNPERVGCPGRDILRRLATKELPISHPAREHIARCSPCFQEFREIHREMTGRCRRGKILATAAGIVIACGTAITLTQFHFQESVIARWDLQNASPSRDFNDYQQPVHLEAPAKKGTIAVTLPLGSEADAYGLPQTYSAFRLMEELYGICINLAQNCVHITRKVIALHQARMFRFKAGLQIDTMNFRLVETDVERCWNRGQQIVSRLFGRVKQNRHLNLLLVRVH